MTVMALDELLAANIGPLLRDRGFRGGPRSYWRASGDMYCTIQFQGSIANRPGLTRFIVNYGIRHQGVAREMGIGVPGPKSFAGSQVGMTATRTKQGDWWEIRDRESAALAMSSVRAAIVDQVLPFLEEYGTEVGFRRYWEAQPAAFERHTSMFIKALDRIASDKSARET